MRQIPGIPPGVRSEELVSTLNDRLRKVNDALGSTSTSSPTDGKVQIAYASAALALVAVTYKDIAGASLMLTAGRYLITACFDFAGAGLGDGNVSATGQLVANGVAQAGVANFQMLVLSGTGLASSPVALRCSVYQQWVYTAPTGVLVKLQAQKSAGTGGSTAAVGTSIAAIRVSS